MADGRNRLTALFAGILLCACGSPQEAVPEPEVEAVPVPAPEAPDEIRELDVPTELAVEEKFETATSRGGKYTIQWRPVGGEVPKNEHFELEVRLYKNVGDELVPLPDARLAVSGWMPDHGHGMIRQPQAVDQGDGSYLVRGMLFHMGGHWQLFFDVIEDGLSERTDFEVDL